MYCGTVVEEGKRKEYSNLHHPFEIYGYEDIFQERMSEHMHYLHIVQIYLE